MTMIETDDLVKAYGERVALGPLSMRIERGEFVALAGHNGSGKTTLLQLCAGLVEPTSGAIQVCGAAAGSLPARTSVSFLPDNPSLFDDLSVREHLEYLAGLYADRQWEARGRRLLDLLGLADRADEVPGQLSRGMRQKAALALALVRPFELLLLDEPFDGLDPDSRSALSALLTEAHGDGATIVVSTHRVEEITSATRCQVLRDGRVEYDGPVAAAPEP